MNPRHDLKVAWIQLSRASRDTLSKNFLDILLTTDTLQLNLINSREEQVWYGDNIGVFSFHVSWFLETCLSRWNFNFPTPLLQKLGEKMKWIITFFSLENVFLGNICGRRLHISLPLSSDRVVKEETIIRFYLPTDILFCFTCEFLVFVDFIMT